MALEVVADGNILRLVEKFLKAGVMEGGKFVPTRVGTPQGGVATPQTILQTAPLGAWVKRERIDSVYHTDLGLVYLYSLHQRADDFASC